MICLNCKTDKADSEFAVKRSGRRSRWCKACAAVASKVEKRSARKVCAFRRQHFGGDRPTQMGRNYIGRNKWLELLGFANYKAYLQSSLWRQIRDRVFAAKGRICCLCGERASQVHHNRYHANDLTGRRIKYLKPICDACHESIEFQNDGRKSTVRQAGKSFTFARKHYLNANAGR